jgi:hypothetical protein
MYMIKAMTIVAPANYEKGSTTQRCRVLGLPTHPAAMRRCCVDWDRGALAFGAIIEGSVDVGVSADATAAGFKSDDIVGYVARGREGVEARSPNAPFEGELLSAAAGPETCGARIKDCENPALAYVFLISLGFRYQTALPIDYAAEVGVNGMQRGSVQLIHLDPEPSLLEMPWLLPVSGEFLF